MGPASPGPEMRRACLKSTKEKALHGGSHAGLDHRRMIVSGLVRLLPARWAVWFDRPEIAHALCQGVLVFNQTTNRATLVSKLNVPLRSGKIICAAVGAAQEA